VCERDSVIQRSVSANYSELKSLFAREVIPKLRAAAPPDHRTPRRTGCANRGKLHSQSRKQVTRRIYLCNDCFGRLAAWQLTDLFKRFTDERA
jgi:hypothetical protein